MDNVDNEKKDKPHEVLKQYFGYDEFRPGQKELIDAILRGRDVLGVLPTGGGKSICYQVPALLLPGITLVISPLISLMRDQVQALNASGVHAAFINSSLTESQTRKALLYASEGRYKIIYVAPERLMTDNFLSFTATQQISLIAVDEAHCISQWGQDFRPSYRRIADFAGTLRERPVLAAFTATATERVQYDIVTSLDLETPKKLITGFDRKNLYFAVKKQHNKRGYVLNFLSEHPDESGIIYCATRKAVDQLYQYVMDAGIRAARYHAGLSNAERLKSQEDFIFDRVPVIIATNAFGMGIDKSSVRFVIHYNMPASLENYYQEAGRAGRDGEPADCILLYSGQDVILARYLIDHAAPVEGMTPEDRQIVHRQNLYRLEMMRKYCMTQQCLRKYILNYFGEDAPEDCGNCSVCLGEAETDEAVEGSGERARERRREAARQRAKHAHAGASREDLDPRQLQLFTILKAVRTDWARQEGRPPFIIFSDRTLVDMALKEPCTMDAFMNVSGVGDAKAARYGASFLDAIQRFRAAENSGGTERLVADAVKAGGREFPARGPQCEFYLTPEEAASFPYQKRYLVAELARVLNTLRDAQHVKKIFGTTIQNKMIALGYLRTINNGRFIERKVTAAGADFGLELDTRVGQKGQEYLDVYYTREAQRGILEMFTLEPSEK